MSSSNAASAELESKKVMNVNKHIISKLQVCGQFKLFRLSSFAVISNVVTQPLNLLLFNPFTLLVKTNVYMAMMWTYRQTDNNQNYEQ